MQARDLFARHLTVLQPQSVTEAQGPLTRQLVLEGVAETAVTALAVPGLARVGRVVEVGDRVALLAELERHRVPGQVDVAFLLGPVARRAWLALAVGAEEVGFVLGLDGHL